MTDEKPHLGSRTLARPLGTSRPMVELTKGARIVTCDLYTHPLGGEVRCDVAGEMFGTHASRRLEDLVEASDRWKAAFQEKGWTTT